MKKVLAVVLLVFALILAVGLAGAEGIQASLGEATITLKKAEIGIDTDGEACVNFYFDWSHTAKGSNYFSSVYTLEAFQGGIQMQKTYCDEIQSELLTDIKAGATLGVVDSFAFRNDSPEIELEVYGGIDNKQDKELVYTFLFNKDKGEIILTGSNLLAADGEERNETESPETKGTTEHTLGDFRYSLPSKWTEEMVEQGVSQKHFGRAETNLDDGYCYAHKLTFDFELDNSPEKLEEYLSGLADGYKKTDGIHDFTWYRSDINGLPGGIAACFTSLKDGMYDTRIAFVAYHNEVLTLTIMLPSATPRMLNDFFEYVTGSLRYDKESLGTPIEEPIDIPTETEKPVEPVSTKNVDSLASPSQGESNALRSAGKYLAIMPFSHKGLVGQLEYEGYTNAEATYAADNCGADWNEQATKSAAKYLKVMSFSRKGLIEQLEYEGYTKEQAEYGAKQNGY